MNSLYTSVEAQSCDEFKTKQQLNRNESVFIQSEINYTRSVDICLDITFPY
jgi:hypothetical protein